MFTLDEVHGILENLEATIEQLSQEQRSEIEVTEAGELCLIIGDVVGWGTAYSDMPAKLGINASLLSKFVRLRGRVRTSDARKIADRLRTYVRSFDQASRRTEPTKKAATENVLTKALSFQAEQWTAIKPSSNVKLKIAAVAGLLDQIIEQATKTNLPPDQQILTEIERNQLIAILETTLHVLKSPLTEKSLLKRAREGLQRAAASAAEKGVQRGLGMLAEHGVEKLTELIQTIFERL